MPDVRCKTCIWFDNITLTVEDGMGVCIKDEDTRELKSENDYCGACYGKI